MEYQVSGVLLHPLLSVARRILLILIIFYLLRDLAQLRQQMRNFTLIYHKIEVGLNFYSQMNSWRVDLNVMPKFIDFKREFK